MRALGNAFQFTIIYICLNGDWFDHLQETQKRGQTLILYSRRCMLEVHRRLACVAAAHDVNSCPLSLSIINDTISSGAVWHNCPALIADCLVGKILSPTKLNRYWFSGSFRNIMRNCVQAVWEAANLLCRHVSAGVFLCSAVCVYSGGCALVSPIRKQSTGRGFGIKRMLNMLYRTEKDVGCVVRYKGSSEKHPLSQKEGHKLVWQSDKQSYPPWI